MTDLSKLNDSIAKLSSALEGFFGAQDPPVQPSDQPGVDAAVKQIDAIVKSIPPVDAKRPFARPEKTGVQGVGQGPTAQGSILSPVKKDEPANAVVFAPAEPAKT